MEHGDFEGTVVLEKLAEHNLVEDFFEAIDSDDTKLVRTLLKRAGVEAENIAMVLRMLQR